MKYLIINLIFLFPFVLIAQKKKVELSIESQGGYEYNISKNPTSFSNDEDDFDKTDMVLSSPILNTKFGLNIYKKNKKHLFKFNTGLGYKFYGQFSELSRFNLKFNPEYQYKFSKSLSFIGEGTFKYVHRNHLKNENILHTIPNPYYAYGMSGGLQLKPSKKQKLLFTLGQNKKVYISESNASLKYDETFAKAYFRQKFDKKSFISQTTLSAQWKLRKYVGTSSAGNSIIDEDLLDDNLVSSSDVTTNQYSLNYIIIKGTLRLKLSKHLYLKPGVEWTRRTGINRNTLNYNQYKILADFVYKKDKTSLKFKTSYAYKAYPNTFPNPDFPVEPLNYQYLKLGINWEQQLSKKLFLTTDFGLTKRISNLDNDTIRIRRSFLYGYGTIGIKFVF